LARERRIDNSRSSCANASSVCLRDAMVLASDCARSAICFCSTCSIFRHLAMYGFRSFKCNGARFLLVGAAQAGLS
jgi:hypothetical protein